MQLVRDTPFEVGFHAFQVRPPQDALVVVVKATFALRADAGPCALADEQRPVVGDVYDDDDPNRTLRYASDLVPFKLQGEFLLTGTCHAPPGGTRTSAVLARVGDLEKSLAVFGDRTWNRGIFANSFSPPTPFVTMPLGWERSFGGPGVSANPEGAGIARPDAPAGTPRTLPNLEHPQRLLTAQDQRVAPQNFGPVSPLWSPRRERTGTYDRAWQKTRWPYHPADFDWQHYNTAPDDQQLKRAYFRGDEDLALKNLHPTHFDAKCRLAGYRPRAFVVPVAGGFREVELRLDTIVIDGDAWQVLCVWRGLTDLAHPMMRDLSHLFVGHDEPFVANSTAHFEQRFREKIAEPAPKPPPAAPVADATPPPPVANDNDDEQDALDAIEADLEAIGAAPEAPPGPKPPDVAEAVAAMAAAGLEVPPGLEALLLESEEPEDAAQPPAVSAKPALRALVEGRVARGESLAELDLTGADLSGLDLRGVDLSRAVLKQANLMRCALDRAKLEGAVLVECVLTDASLRHALLTGADLSRAGGVRASFESAWLDEVLAHDVDLCDCRFTRTSMKKSEWVDARLERSDLSDALLDQADFTAAKLSGCSFVRSSMVEAVLERAEGERVDLTDCVLTKLRAADERTHLADATLRGVKGEGSLWSGARLERANFSFAKLAGADFSNALLVQAIFDGASARGARFDYASMVAVAMRKTDAMACNFEGADVSHGDLRGANLYATQFFRANTQLAQFANALLGKSTLATR